MADREVIDQAVVRGSDCLKRGKLDEAAAAFRAALAIEPGNPRVLPLLGLAHFRAGEYAPARAIYEDLVERLPTDASHRLNLGLVYLKLGDAGNAIEALEASRALDPSAGRAVSYLGLAYARAGRYAEAYRAFLLAGQAELANEIASNLTEAERDSIHHLLRSSIPLPMAELPTARAESLPRASMPDLGATSLAVSAPAGPQLPSNDPNAPRLTDSQEFVSPFYRAAPAISPAATISRAVAAASPAMTREATHGLIPLSQLATSDLVRPDDGDEPFEIAPGGTLVIRVADRVLTRLDGVNATGGDLTFEPALRRARGRQSDEGFDYGGSQLHLVTGRGYLIASPDTRAFTAVTLDDDIFYLREDLVFAFAAKLRWENGHVPGLRGRLPVVQFRGDGAVALRSERPLARVKLPASGILFVDAARLAGWIGRVIPRAVVPPAYGPMGGDVCVECTGEGVVLIDPQGDPGLMLVDAPNVIPLDSPRQHVDVYADVAPDAQGFAEPREREEF